jgi:hypothetical protein
MYDKLKIKRWETPISDSKWLGMLSFYDVAESNILEIRLNDGKQEISIKFENYPAYRNILEEYRTALWRHLDKTSQKCGWTFEVINSSWSEELNNEEPLLEIHNPGLRHFVISTNDDVIEVLSNLEPKIKIMV